MNTYYLIYINVATGPSFPCVSIDTIERSFNSTNKSINFFQLIKLVAYS